MSTGENQVDNYQLVNCLSQGRHSQIWEALDIGTSRSVALKLLLHEAFQQREQKQSIKYEYKVGSTLDHPNIIKMLECTVSRDHAYIAMELFRAHNVKVQIRSNHHELMLRARKLIELTAEALRHMHEKGWIHKDIKPENILINRAAEVRLIDFSLAGKPASSIGTMVNRKKKGKVQGTRTYMAPEQIRNQPLTIKTDLYGFGITIYEILAGRPPFRSQHPDQLLMDHLKTQPPNPSHYNPNITAEMDHLILKMLSKKPKDRQNDIDEFLAEFRNTKIFREEIKEKSQKSEEEIQNEMLKAQDEGISSRLDSRLDAMRSEARKRDPNYKPPEPPKKKAPPIAEPPKEPVQPPAPAAQAPPAMPQQMPPGGMMTPDQILQHQQMLLQQQAWYQQQQGMYQQPMYPQMYPQQGMPMSPGMPLPPPPQSPTSGQPPAPPAQLPQPPAPAHQPPQATQPPQPPKPQAQQPPAAKQPAPAAKPEKKKEKSLDQGTKMSLDDLEDMFNSLPDA